jgi:hypothetical protein
MASCGTITVLPEFDPSLVSASCNVGQASVNIGDTFTVSATVTNENEADASYTLTFEVGSGFTEQVSGTVRGGGTQSESITVRLQSAEDFPVNVSVDAQRA